MIIRHKVDEHVHQPIDDQKNIGDHRNIHNDLLMNVGECRRTWRDFGYFKPQICHPEVLASLFYDIQRRIYSHTEQRFLKNPGDW